MHESESTVVRVCKNNSQKRTNNDYNRANNKSMELHNRDIWHWIMNIAEIKLGKEMNKSSIRSNNRSILDTWNLFVIIWGETMRNCFWPFDAL